MVDMTFAAIQGWSNLAAAVAFGVLAIYLRLGWRGGKLGGRLLVAVLASAVFALVAALAARVAGPELAEFAQFLIPVSEPFEALAWSWFLIGLLAVMSERHEIAKYFAQCALMIFGVAVLVNSLAVWSLTWSRWALYVQLLISIALLVLLEQVYRNCANDERWGVKPLVLGLAAGWCFDVYVFAEGALFGVIDANIVSVRGVVHALAVPLIAMSAVRSRDWTFHISVSRNLVFHSTALAGSGAYLLLIAAAGYYVRWFGGGWGRALQTVLIVTGLLVLVSLFVSGSLRARLKVWVNKNLFALRYDYRESWLRFTRSLSQSHDNAHTLEQSIISAFADLVESPGGSIWFLEADDYYRPRAKWNAVLGAGAESAASPLMTLMRNRNWIVNLEEWRSRPQSFEGGSIPAWLSQVADAWLLVPLISDGEMSAFVVLNTPRTSLDVNWEVIDLLRTAGAQAAGYLQRAQAIAALLEAQKFDSFNRMSAFVVHDLKNLVAQMSLMLKNATRHKDNPEFQADMLMTVENVVERMRNLMVQLQNKEPIEQARPLDLVALCLRLAQERHIVLENTVSEPVWVAAHAERLHRTIGHLLQNALEATGDHGNVSPDVGTDIKQEMGEKVRLRLLLTAERAQIVVEDEGCGMSEQFIRERLFRPFQTTKTTGMGIGAYEVRQYVTELGGQLEVASQVGVGSRFVMHLPRVHPETALG